MITSIEAANSFNTIMASTLSGMIGAQPKTFFVINLSDGSNRIVVNMIVTIPLLMNQLRQIVSSGSFAISFEGTNYIADSTSFYPPAATMATTTDFPTTTPSTSTMSSTSSSSSPLVSTSSTSTTPDITTPTLIITTSSTTSTSTTTSLHTSTSTPNGIEVKFAFLADYFTYLTSEASSDVFQLTLVSMLSGLLNVPKSCFFIENLTAGNETIDVNMILTNSSVLSSLREFVMSGSMVMNLYGTSIHADVNSFLPQPLTTVTSSTTTLTSTTTTPIFYPVKLSTCSVYSPLDVVIVAVSNTYLGTDNWINLLHFISTIVENMDIGASSVR